MISNLAKASERDVYWEWVRAEVDVPPGSPRSRDRRGHGLDARQLSLLAGGEKGALRPADWEALEAAFRRLRGNFLDPLLGSGTRWSYGELPVAELVAVKIPNLTISFVPLAPSRRLDEFVAALDGGKETPDLSNHLIYRFLRPVFDPRRARGCPVLIAERTEGALVLAEGLTRVCVLVSRHTLGEPTPRSIRVLLGVSPRAREWPWF